MVEAAQVLAAVVAMAAVEVVEAQTAAPRIRISASRLPLQILIAPTWLAITSKFCHLIHTGLMQTATE